MDLSKYSEKIQKYLANELSENELAEFEDLVNKHSELKDEIQLYRKVSGAIADASLEDFKNDLEKIHNQNFGNQNNITYAKSKQWYLLAALFLIMITIASVFLFKNNETNIQAIFEKYYQPLEADYTRSLEEDSNTYVFAMNAFCNKNYNLAFVQFKDLVAIDNENYSARLYLGVCGIELSEFSMAETQFKLIIESGDPFYKQDAEWYLALLYLKMEDVEKAKSIFEVIQLKSGVFYKDASLVLNDIKQFQDSSRKYKHK